MSFTRRSFLGAGLSLAASGAATSGMTIGSASAGHSSFDPWVEVHAGNLRHNVGEIRRRIAGRPILAVTKNNGYGMGVENAGRLLEPIEAVAGVAVVKLDEAFRLRDSGFAKPVLLMGPFDELNLEEAVARDIIPMIYTPLGESLDRLARKRQRPAPIHVCVDTGIGRVGVPFRQAGSLIRDLAARPSVRIEGLMMTFTEDVEFDREQLKRFHALCGDLDRNKVPYGKRHAASTYPLFQHDDSFLDMVRPGLAVCGIYPEPEFRPGPMELKPALALRTRVVYVKQLGKGESAGYSRAYRAARDVWVATLPMGHTDGVPRAAARGAKVRIRENLYPVIASVSASHCIVEIGPEKEVETGDVATFFDWAEGSRPEDVSASCGTSVYDLCMHLNPLLPRRVV